MRDYDSRQLLRDYERDGVVVIRQLLTAEEVAMVRQEIARYVREDLPSKPRDAATRESDGKTVRNLWRLEQHNPVLGGIGDRAAFRALVSPLVRGEPVLHGAETFDKPPRVSSGVPYHQDNSYFCQAPPDMLTLWIAIDPVTEANGPVTFYKGTHRLAMLPTKPSGVRGNSIGLADPESFPREADFRALLDPGDATIHHCMTIHHSEANQSPQSRLALLFVYRGAHTKTDPALHATYSVASALMPPA